jgi:dipeptidyl aminopeptidase/acylaminoacyl peptidase
VPTPAPPSRRLATLLLLALCGPAAAPTALARAAPAGLGQDEEPASRRAPRAPLRQGEEPDVPRHEAAERDAVLSQAAAAVFDAHQNSSPVLTPDGARVVFLSTRPGLPQLFVAETARPDAPAVRLAKTAQRMASPVVLPDGARVLFLSDRGADEQWSLWSLPLTGGAQLATPVELTPGRLLQRDAPHVPARAPATAYYAARALSDAGAALHALPLGTAAGERAEERVVFRDALPGAVLDVSADGTRALWKRSRARTDSELLVVDLATGEARTLYPAGGATSGRAVSVHAARFSADGTRALLSTDEGAERAALLSLDVRTGRETARYVERSPATALLSALEVAPRGDALAVAVNAGSHSEVRLLDARTLKARARVKLPLGTGALGPFSQDGKRLALSWSTPSTPGDLHALDARSGKTAPLRQEERKGLEGFGAVEASLATVKAHDGLTLPVNVYLPRGARAEGRRLPVVVSFHGGPAGVSQVKWSPSVAFLLSQGWAVVEPNVRGSVGFGRAFEMADDGRKRPEALQDVETVSRWAAAQPWAEGRRMAVMGGSYGGYTVLMALARMPGFWRAGVDLFGVADLRTTLATTTGAIRETFRTELGELGRDDAFLASISPLPQAERITTPLFVYAGANDPRVPRLESDAIVQALRARDVPVEYMVAEDEGHSLAKRKNWREAHARIARFLEQHVRPGLPEPVATPDVP